MKVAKITLKIEIEERRYESMLRYENIAYITISVNLQNDYSVLGMISRNMEEGQYHATLYIKRNDISILDLVEKAEDLIFESDAKSIKVDVTRKISALLDEGFFTYYINRYEYEQKCFDRGNDLFEMERLKLHQ